MAKIAAPADKPLAAVEELETVEELAGRGGLGPGEELEPKSAWRTGGLPRRLSLWVTAALPMKRRLPGDLTLTDLRVRRRRREGGNVARSCWSRRATPRRTRTL